MEHLLSYCGLSCETCQIFQATLEMDIAIQEKLRESIAEECRTIHGMNIQAVDITDCDGCRADSGRIFAGCLDCAVRKCARERTLESCAFCSDYACDRLLNLFSIDQEARIRLEDLRKARRD